MNFHLKQMPERTRRPEAYGLTMINDKGLSVAEAGNLVSGAYPHIDLVKLAFGTSLVTADLSGKLKVYRDAGIPVYFWRTIV